MVNVLKVRLVKASEFLTITGPGREVNKSCEQPTVCFGIWDKLDGLTKSFLLG